MPKRPRTHPVNKYSERPFRIWDPQAKPPRNVPRRYYTDAVRAHEKCHNLVLWSRVGRVLEVYTARRGHLLGIYKRSVNGVLTPFLERPKDAPKLDQED